MPALLPPNRPAMSAAKLIAAASAALAVFGEKHGVNVQAVKDLGFLSFGIRGYFRDTMGKPGENDFHIFDDAVAVIDWRKNTVKTWNWNTDPNYGGFNPAVGRPYAILAPGLWMFCKGQHKNKGLAWRQIDEETSGRYGLGRFVSDKKDAPVVRRNGNFAVYRGAIGVGLEWGYQAINQHWATGSTSSFGCQTCPGTPESGQWAEYREHTYGLSDGQRGLLPYLLHDNIANPIT